MSKTVCVTGGGGFIGSHLAERCLEEGHEVRVLDNFSTGDPRNLDPIRGRVEVHRSDIRSRRKVGEAFEGVDWVFHQAAKPSVPRSMEDPLGTTDITFMGTLNVLEMARRRGVKRLVYASSSSVYGNQPGQPREESMMPRPESPYAASKQACENFARVYARNLGLHTVGLRYFNVFGPRQDPASDYAAVVPSFVHALLTDTQAVIYGDGEQSRDFTYVGDVVEANLLAVRNGPAGRVFNVGYNQQMSVNRLFELLRDIVGSDQTPRHDDPRPGDVRESRADVESLREEVGFSPSHTPREGLEKTVRWFKDHPDRLRGEEP